MSTHDVVEEENPDDEEANNTIEIIDEKRSKTQDG